jgi:hypothetical protein
MPVRNKERRTKNREPLREVAMFRLNVLQNQWLVLALAGGLTIVLWLVLYYLAMWRERPGAAAQETAPSGRNRRWFPPALLVFVYLFILIWAVVYTLMMIRNPPNW